MTTQFNVNGAFFRRNQYGKKVTIDMGGGSLYDATKQLSLKEVLATEWVKHPKYGWCQTDKREKIFVDTDGNYYTREFDHYNGHFSNYTEGVYEVTFTKMARVRAAR